MDPAVLTQLDATVGDSLVVGDTGVRIVGTVEGLPTDVGFQSAVGPRVWMSGEQLRGAGLLEFGSLARYKRYIALPGDIEAGELWVRYGPIFRGYDVGFTTAREQARDLTSALDYLGSYLGLVGLGALLLGGVGVASAVHVYVREKATTVAVLRCLGARQWPVVTAYVMQALALGVIGSVAGAVIGIVTQHLLPFLLADALPVTIRTASGMH